MFSPETYTERRKKLAASVGSGVILLPGNEESSMNYPDNTYAFRQDSAFLYFFGLDAPHLAGVIDVDEGRHIVFGNDITMDDIIWMGPQPPLVGEAAKAGVGETLPFDDLAAYLEKARTAGRAVHYLPPYRGETVLLLHSLLGASVDEVRAGVSVPLVHAVVEQRAVKSDEEVAQIEMALDISYAMHTTAMRFSKPGLVEREVVGAVNGITLARGGLNSFPTIFTVHGETLHNHHHHNTMADGDIVIHDSGAESPLHYASDITRTFPVSGKFTARQRDVYSIVLDSQTQAIEAIRPGVMMRDVHYLASEVLVSGLRELGLVRGDVKEAVQAGVATLFFQCGLGHLMGLDVHDMEGLGEDRVGYDDTIQRDPRFGFCSLRLGRKLEKDFVVTVEPGLYFIPALIDQWKAENKLAEFVNYDAVDTFRDFGGVRIEDDVLVTADGHRVLGRPIPKTIDEVEATCG